MKPTADGNCLVRREATWVHRVCGIAAFASATVQLL